MTRCAVSLGCFLLAVIGSGFARAEAEAEKKAATGAAFFEDRIRPLLSQRCYKCHGPDKQEGNLRLDRYSGITSGGDSGALIVPGKPDESLLLIAVSYQNEDLQMPPDGKLPEEDLKALREWVSQGVPHPDATKASRALPPVPGETAEQPPLWSFQTPVTAPLPQVRDAGWPTTAIDRFLLADLESHGLSPRQRTDRRTLIRRATFGLIGLPPTPAEIDEFCRDESPDAFNKLVDRLLESPHYGQRWGRHWLDIARYADSNGLDENVAHGNAWRYRDYVLEAFNQDKPFDQFLREQIAGDLLPAESEALRHERLIAIGFLSLGAKVLAEVDERKMEMDIVDEQIDTVGRAILGLTLGCARCHDHKFDPIRTEDYYALAGVFRSTKTMENFTKVARWNENVIATPNELAAKEAHNQKVAEQKASIQRVVDEANKTLLATMSSDAKLPPDAETKYAESTKAELKRLRDELAQLQKAAPPLPSAMGVLEGTIADTCVCIRGSHLTPGPTVPRRIPAVLAPAASPFPAAQSGRRELADWLADRRNPLTPRVIVNRVWRWHFGRGLVESTDNFGRLGDRPTNQQLLDWLAIWFVDQGWSIKNLHRLILASAVYQQESSVTDQPSQVREVDPNNHLLWHFPVRRLEAEAIRDSLLAVSEQLDTARGGSLLHVGNREYLFDHTSKDNTKYDSRKRSIYLPVIRNNLYDVFQLFDSTDATVPSGDRASSTVATQALFMLNGPLVVDSAQALAKNLLAEIPDDRQRVCELYERCFGRLATSAEINRALTFVTDFASSPESRPASAETAPVQAWTAFCQVLFASNDFMYVR